MTIIDRYIYAIGRHLPGKNKSDIQIELRSNLMEALEARYSKDASEEQVVELVKEFGQPEKVAASYWPEGQYLIGPRLYPLFRLVVGISITVFVIVQLAAGSLGVIFNQGHLPGLAFWEDVFTSTLTAFGMIVLIFAVLQRLDVRPETEKEDWDPRTLPEIEEQETVNRVGTVVEIAFASLITAILVALGGKVGAVVTLGSEMIINPVLVAYVPLIVLGFLLSIGLDVVLLWRGRWETGSRIAKTILNLFGIGLLYVLVMAHHAWLAEHGVTGIFSWINILPDGGQLNTEQVQILVVNGFRIGFIVALIVSVVDTVGSIFRLVRRLLADQAISSVVIKKF